jgi:serine/threonine protein kinase
MLIFSVIQNVLVVHASPKWWVKLADFGLSKRLTDTTAYHTRSGTPSYMAPEVLGVLDASDSSSGYTNAVDIWAAGCIIYRLIAGHAPFPQIKALVKYCEDESLFPYDDPFGSKAEKEGSSFIRQLLVSDPNNRPSASQAAKHTWIISGKSQVLFVAEMRVVSICRPSHLTGQVLSCNMLAVE